MEITKSQNVMLNLIQHLKPRDLESSSGLWVISQILAWPMVGLVWAYQKTISPDHGGLRGLYPFGYCKFYPTCSEYARLVLIKDGVLGLPKIIKRLISCRPGTSPQVHLP